MVHENHAVIARYGEEIAANGRWTAKAGSSE